VRRRAGQGRAPAGAGGSAAPPPAGVRADRIRFRLGRSRSAGDPLAKTKPPPLDDEIRGLYHGALAEFTAARGALAKRLRRAGDRRAGAVGELRKPPPSAWAVNRLFAGEPRAMTALVGAGERARAAQRRVGKGGDAAALRDLVATIRGETDRLTGRGVEILSATERAPGEAIVERLRINLQALALDPATAPVAARGFL
jgi:hypothetical protein